MTLSKDQLQALEVLKAGNNCFITGNAGSGKSYILDYYTSKYCSKKLVAKVAFTALAANNLTKDKDSDIVTTIHDLFRLTGPEVISPIKWIDRDIAKAISKYDLLIIDEISMVRIDIFDYIARVITKANKYRLEPIQLVVLGDFYQLPPIMDNKITKLITKYYDSNTGYCFNSQYWPNFEFKVINLVYNFRINKDKQYLNHLNNIRRGRNLVSTLAYFNKALNNSKIDATKAIGIYPTNYMVNKHNRCMLAKLKGKATSIHAYYDNEIRSAIRANSLEANNLVLELKPKALVMFNRNDKLVKDKARRFVNGDLATVISCEEKEVVVRLLKNNKLVHLHKYNCSYNLYKPVKSLLGVIYQDEYLGLIKQYPLTLAYGLTIHKAQGKTLPAIIFDPAGNDKHKLGHGQVYTALSRVKCLDDLKLVHKLTLEQITVNQEVINFYSSIEGNIEDWLDVICRKR